MSTYLKKIFLFGGLDINNGSSINLVHSFDPLTKQWNELSIKLPLKLSNFGFCSIQNIYCIFGGGMTLENSKIVSTSDKLYLFNVLQMKIVELKRV